MLVIGDSLVHNANFATIEIATNSRIRTIKAYGSIRDNNARYPHKNIIDVTPVALVNTPEEDEFSHLILGAPTVDITNLDTSKLRSNDNIEAFKQKTLVSCHNMFTAAQNALKTHPGLKKVVLMEHAPRHDTTIVDPTGLKPKLAQYANASIEQMWHSSAMKEKILIGKHSLYCGDNEIAARYRDDWTGRFDGVHMYGRQGKDAYTDSVCQIMKPALHKASSSPLFSSSSHSTCPQAQHQERQQQKSHRRNEDIYNVPVQNQFDILGN